ncbi:hypothetical protein PSH47_10940 [Pseudoalteromonas sp. CST5]|uniref:hypothetical protein n=1 Tax=unclassified Pseudoalteromonas TaxID=194690 RepID=UPI0023593496|nr:MULTISPECIES: hypothetical protein [unclassified Pseudoalteromonas]MDC9514989.1 hypothetical protein [Pseudoalteromonas sp. CST1]MDC9538049.1 hypothetical protein [Pseudoalteromonas sp. CST3]MDC9542294.1 hypothetical protein [Pseudoalteromonas sp. CST2]MDC9546575.1 hypothetical protein [Pseudoalteromonas sp. CST4]MDC9549664.1 hypothetical protein [Pseudoalteromonas sp. CST5]
MPNYSTPAWVNIRTIGRSKIMTLTIFIPVIGYMIIFNEQLIHLFELSENLFSSITVTNATQEDVVSEDSKTRLFYFYFGFTFLGLGSLLFQVFCPNLIKEHGSDREFIKEELSLMTIKRVKSILDFLHNKVPEKNDELVKLQNDISFSTSGISNDDMDKRYKSATINLMLMQWQYENWSSKNARRFINFFYSIGFLILAIPSIEMFYKVAKEFIS